MRTLCLVYTVVCIVQSLSCVQLFATLWTVVWRQSMASQSWYTHSVQSLSHVRLCDPMDCSTPGFPVHHQLPPETCSNSCPSSRWCHPPILSSVVPFSSCLQSVPASGSSPVSHFFASDGQRIGVSASASVLPVNNQGWFPLGWTGWISLLSKGLSRVFSSTTAQRHYCATRETHGEYLAVAKPRAGW